MCLKSFIRNLNNNFAQQYVIAIASKGLLTKIPEEFSIYDYLLTLVRKNAMKSYTNR